MALKFYLCKHCGNIAVKPFDSGVPLVCCGEKMEEIVPNTEDAAVEKHVPVVTVDGQSVHVQVGGVLHPMTPEHLIEWVYLQTRRGAQRKRLKPTDPPEVTFRLEDDQAEAVYAYCNLHGLWKTEL